MDTERLNYLLNNPSDVTKEDILLLDDAVKDYPYAQCLHILRAKIGFALEAEDKNKKLSTAAIYASNRSVLKQVIEANAYLESIDEVVVFQSLPIIELDQQTPIANTNSPGENAESESANIFDEVLKNLQKLKALREQFLFLEAEESEDETPKSEPASAKKKTNQTESAKKIIDESNSKRQKPKRKKDKVLGGSKKERPKARDDKMEKLQKKDLELDSKVNEYFMLDISQKDASNVNEKTHKLVSQEQIIEKFIQEQPSIGNIKKELEKSREEITKDLSEKSTEFGDDLISENLAIILLKQGKKERAIDIYRKLIWKLPQKKAYFAARIEEIKK